MVCMMVVIVMAVAVVICDGGPVCCFGVPQFNSFKILGFTYLWI